MVALAPILRLVRENSSVGNFCFLFKHFSEAPTPVLNREVRNLVHMPESDTQAHLARDSHGVF